MFARPSSLEEVSELPWTYLICKAQAREPQTLALLHAFDGDPVDMTFKILMRSASKYHTGVNGDPYLVFIRE